MITAVQHIPAFVDLDTAPPRVNVDNLEELLRVPWIAQWANDDDWGTFHRWSLSDNRLMAELNDGRKWWVVAVITRGLDELMLPKWTPNRNCK